jgi:hypothetical protein
LTYLDLKLSVNPNFEEGLMDTIFAKVLEKCAQSLPPPSSISLFVGEAFPNHFLYLQLASLSNQVVPQRCISYSYGYSYWQCFLSIFTKLPQRG